MLRLILFLLCPPLLAQTNTESIDPEGATGLHLSANFSNVDIRQGEGDQITVEHSVIVEGEPRPDLAVIEVERDGSTIHITDTSPDRKDLEEIWRGESRRDNCCNSEINMIVRVPAGMEVTLATVYGGVEVENLPGLQKVDATYGTVTVVASGAMLAHDLELYSNYGGVDIRLPENARADLELQTQFGELLTDLDIAIDEDRSERRDFFERVVGTIGGGGARVRCEAPYGKVYLRGR